MKTSISRSCHHSLLIESDDLDSIFVFLKSKYDFIELSANCSDGSVLETQNIQDLIDFENLNFRKLESVAYKAKSVPDETFVLSLTANASDSAELQIVSMNDERALYIAEEMEKRLLNMKPSYDWLARMSILLGFSIIISVGWLFSQIVQIANIVRVDTSKISITEYINQNVLFLLIIFGITYPLEKLKKFLFPKVFFLIGRQVKTMESVKQWRNLIFGTFFLTIVLGLLTNWLSSVFMY